MANERLLNAAKQIHDDITTAYIWPLRKEHVPKHKYLAVHINHLEELILAVEEYEKENPPTF